MTRYQIIEAQDGIYWVPLQPLVADIRERIDAALAETTDPYTLHAMRSVDSFLNALISEGMAKSIKQGVTK
jgi:hypothetical protein